LFKRIGLLALAATLLACEKPSPEQQFVETSNAYYIAPGYQSLAQQIALLAAEVQQSCAGPANVDKPKLQQQWRVAMAAWQGIRAINFGPIEDHNLAWELQFWPDKKNLVAKKLRPLFKRALELDQASFAKTSSVAHGLPALEYLLFDSTVAQRGSSLQQCQLMVLIAEHLKNVSADLNLHWQQYQTTLLNPGPKNTSFPEAKLALAMIVDSQLNILEQSSNRKLTTALGLKSSKARVNPYMLESWRSQTSRQNLQANINGVATVFFHGGLQVYLQAKQQQALATAIEQQIKAVLALLDAPQPSYFKQLQSQQLANAKAVQTALSKLTQLYKHQLPQALELQLGFNNNDGD